MYFCSHYLLYNSCFTSVTKHRFYHCLCNGKKLYLFFFAFFEMCVFHQTEFKALNNLWHLSITLLLLILPVVKPKSYLWAIHLARLEYNMQLFKEPWMSGVNLIHHKLKTGHSSKFWKRKKRWLIPIEVKTSHHRNIN